MSWTGQKRGYHHGNLREALVEAAMALIAESGPAGFTIAEAARRAASAPRHPIAISEMRRGCWRRSPSAASMR